MRLATTFLAGIALLSGSPQPLLAQGRLPIIDMHMHAMPSVAKDDDGRPLARPCKPHPCQPSAAQAETPAEVLRLTLAAMDRNHIVLGFLSGRSLATVYQWVDAAPGRFLASPAFRDPAAMDLAVLRKEYEAGRLGGMGELAIQYEGIAATDPRMEPFYALAEEFDVPVLVHHHGTGAPARSFRISIGHPEQLEEVLIRHPNLRLSIETAGFPFLEETIALMYRYPQVYGDLSVWKYPRKAFHRYLQGLMDAGLGKRLIWIRSSPVARDSH